MSTEAEPVNYLDSGLYIAPEEDFVSYWHSLTIVQREQYIAMYADFFLTNSVIMELYPDLNISRDQLIDFLSKSSQHVLTIKP